MTELLTEKSLGGLAVRSVEALPKHINFLVYGDPGVGKTVLAGSAATVEAMSPVLIIDIEGGTLSLRDRYPDVDVVRVTNMEEMGKLYDALRRGEGGYKTVVLDSLSEIQKFSMMWIMRGLVKDDPDRDPDVPGLREWGKNTEQVRRLVRAFRDLPISTIFTALASSDRNPKTGITAVKPGLSGKLSAEVAGFLDIVVYMYIKVIDGIPRRFLLTTGTDEQIAKDRSNKLPPVLEDPDMESIWTIVQEGDK